MTNRVGLIIAAVLVVVLGVGMFFIIRGVPNSPTPATAANVLTKNELETPVTTVVPLPQSSCDAADAYQKGVLEYRANKEAFRLVNEIDPKETPNAKLPVLSVSYLLAGAKCGQFNYHVRFLDQPLYILSGEQGNYLTAFQAMSRAGYKQVLLDVGANRLDRAERISRAIVILGWHIWNERVRVESSARGLDIIQTGLEGLAAVYRKQKNNAALEKVLDFSLAVDRAGRRMRDKMTKVTHTPNLWCPDLVRMAERDADKAWRIEAILRLGLARWTSSSRADRRVAGDLLARLSDDPDAQIQSAARRAEKFSRRDVHRMK